MNVNSDETRKQLPNAPFLLKTRINGFRVCLCFSSIKIWVHFLDQSSGVNFGNRKDFSRFCILSIFEIELSSDDCYQRSNLDSIHVWKQCFNIYICIWNIPGPLYMKIWEELIGTAFPSMFFWKVIGIANKLWRS